jgi:hypothetical protein
MSKIVRELKLLPEFAHLYPGLTANVWIRGNVLAQWLATRGSAQPRAAGGGQIVSDRHFEFRAAALPEFVASQ